MSICKGDPKCEAALGRWRERTGNKYGFPMSFVDIVPCKQEKDKTTFKLTWYYIDY